MNLQTIGAIATKILEVAETVAALTPVGAGVVTAIKIASAIGTGLVQDAPQMVAAWNEMQAVKNGGAAPTAEQWAKWDALADSAHADLQAAVAAAQK